MGPLFGGAFPEVKSFGGSPECVWRGPGFPPSPRMLTFPPMERDPVLIAVEVRREGGLVALPTETVYGLGADAENELAVRQIFAVKGRPASHPLIVHIAGADQLDAWARAVPEEARALANT